MKKLFLLISILMILKLQSKLWTEEEVIKIINKVKNYWQINNSPKTNSFWDHAAYHTENMEAFFLNGNKKFLEYSLEWAEYNNWMGATEEDPKKWIYKEYSQSMQHVLFGDWQVCFQTYIDLYNIYPEEKKINRSKEVMFYEAKSQETDYWWWCDALYMVMPVMTKMYKLTNDKIFLDKLYNNLLYSDSIMFDKEEGLYFRDGKYVYPNHKTNKGLKDFWARGDGWVLAGLAKVLADMPKNYKHFNFFKDKFIKLSKSVAELQQDDGYWTRSMMDPEQAPGPETSGTAFFTYGFLWGVNNGYLNKNEFSNIIDKAWRYLTQTAMQNDGKIGYVQPRGEKAIPDQMLDANSQANFGVGAFLLASCEYIRYLKN